MDENGDKTQDKHEKAKNDWYSGMESPNPNGRPKGAKNYLTQLEEALKEEAIKADKTYWQKLAEWCFTNPSMAIAVLKKFIPDRQHTEVSGLEGVKFIVEILNGNKKTKGK